MALGKTLTVYLAADLSKFDAGLGKAKGGLSGFEKGLVAAAAAAGAFALSLAVDGVKAAVEEEQALTRLSTTLANLGFGPQTEQVNQFIDELQRGTGVADDQLRPAFERLARSAGSVGESQRLLQIALDASIGTGKSLQTVADALGKAYDGNTTSLGRLGLGLDKAELKSMSLDDITARLADTFAGQATTAAGTFQGQVNRLSVGFDELKEAFGTGFLRGLDRTEDKTADLADTMRDLEEPIGDIAEAIGGVVVKLADFTSWLADADKAVSNFSQGLINDAAINLLRLADTLGIVSDAQGEVNERDYERAQAAIRSSEATQANADVWQSWTSTVEEASSASDKATTSVGGTRKALEEADPAIVAQTDRIKGLVTALTGPDGAVAALNAAKEAFDSYRSSIQGTLAGGLDLSKILDPNDVEGSLRRAMAAADGASAFGSALGTWAQGLPQTEGAQQLVEYVAGLGPDSGLQFIRNFTGEVGANLANALTASAYANYGTGYLLAKHFYGEGIESATQMVDAMIGQLLKEEKRLRKIGESIGKPIGANIKAEIAEAVAEAVKAAEAAGTAARAEAVAREERRQVALTEQAVAQTLNRLLTNSNARTGYQTTPVVNR